MNHLCYLKKNTHSHPFLGSLPFLDWSVCPSVIINPPTSQHHCCPVLPHFPTWKSQTCTLFHPPRPQSSSALWLFPAPFQTSVPHLPSMCTCLPPTGPRTPEDLARAFHSVILMSMSAHTQVVLYLGCTLASPWVPETYPLPRPLSDL